MRVRSQGALVRDGHARLAPKVVDRVLPVEGELQQLAERKNKGRAGTDFKLLGIKYECTNRWKNELNQGAWDEAKRRCWRIGIALRTQKRRTKYVRMMVLPKALWNAGWQRAPLKNMRALQCM